MMYTGGDVNSSLPVSEKGLKTMRSVFAGIENKAVRLPEGASAEIDDATGAVTVIQSTIHSITLTPGQMVDLVSWVVLYHLGYLDTKAYEATTRGSQCFECREPLTTAYVYRMKEGDIELCSRCHVSVKQTVEELQCCAKCAASTQGQQSYTVMCKGELVEVCFSCFAEIAEGEFQSLQMEYEDTTFGAELQ